MKMAATGRVIPGTMTERTAPGTEVKSKEVTEVILLVPTHLMHRFIPLMVEGSEVTRKEWKMVLWSSYPKLMRTDYEPVEGDILTTIRMKEWEWKMHQGRRRSRGWKDRRLMTMEKMAMMVLMGGHLNCQ